jgi:hypothetical protein
MFVMPVEAQQEATVTKIPEQYQPRGKRKRRVSLLDIELDAAFDASMMFVQSVLQNINAGFESSVADIDFVRSTDPDTVLTAFTASCDVLHVIAHGDHTETPMFVSSDDRTTISLEDLGVAAAERNRGISTGAILPTVARPAPECGSRLCATACRETSPTSAHLRWSAGTRARCSAPPSTVLPFRNQG